ncbi:hypothetical protein WJ97_11345 [Burkholderia ubonensis]|uniref:hypothetical protein n=1 Tax=Burkholderia ubonensis TaxID=101571 RepID=UPI000753A319|nr:hypothetical protein [Burkholderia ubonensis]KVP96477.1 hypothetical protein WJ97_11345 [Burkholderia ubonensis]
MATILNESHIPGPTDEAKALQLTHNIAYDAMYDALNDVRSQNPGISSDDVYQHPHYLEKKRVRCNG